MTQNVARTPADVAAGLPCEHPLTSVDVVGDLELCDVCGELVRYFADDVQEWVEVQEA